MTNYYGLEAYSQFILWKGVPQANGSVTKLPLDHRTGSLCSAHDRTAHTDAATAEQRAADLGVHVGFVVTDTDPLFFVDIDAGLVDGQWRPECVEVLNMFPGAFVETSQSGTGLHIIGSGLMPAGARRCKPKAPDTSFDGLFTEKRFIALTLSHPRGNVNTDHTGSLAHLVETRLRDGAAPGASSEWTTEPEAGCGGLSSNEIVEKAMAARSGASVFGGRATFTELWEANEVALTRHFPDDHGNGYDASKADSALAQHLAFWTGGNCEQVREVMGLSGLKREKWESRGEYYLPRTIMRAVQRQEKFYQPRALVQPAPPPTEAGAMQMRVGLQYLTAAAQQELFAGCVYSREDHKILMPDGEMISPNQFRAHFGGYIFAIDGINDKTTRNAWEVFTESQAVHFPKVVGCRFSPLEAYGTVDPATGRVNTYSPHSPKVIDGDPSIFLRHVDLLLPEPSDRDILLDYLAACVQKIGKKFQWCPLIQGVQGNGKTALTKPLQHAVGAQYCHQQDPEDLGSSFNAWVQGNLLVFIEEIRVGGKSSIANRMKPLITNDRVPLQGKGDNQKTGDNYANFVLFSNYRDAVMKTEDDRRYCVLYTAQQSLADLRRDGMDEAYFEQLYGWLGGDGSAIVTNYLLNREIKVNVMWRAPKSTSNDDAMRESLGAAEQMLMEAIDLEEFGFRGGIINSRQAVAHLAASGKKMSPEAVSRALGNIGYVKPATGSKIQVDGTRFLIYVDKKRAEWNAGEPKFRDLYITANTGV